MMRLLFLALAALLISGCRDEDCVEIIEYGVDGSDPCSKPPPRRDPRIVLNNLQVSYLRREIAHYDGLLADDFRFYPADEARRENPSLPEYWTKEQDVAVTRRLFSDPRVDDIRIQLLFDNPRSVNEPGRETWQRLVVLDTFLEVHTSSAVSRVDRQSNRFCFRKGRTPEDSTSSIWYLVEWRDFGHAEPPAVSTLNP